MPQTAQVKLLLFDILMQSLIQISEPIAQNEEVKREEKSLHLKNIRGPKVIFRSLLLFYYFYFNCYVPPKS